MNSHIEILIEFLTIAKNFAAVFVGIGQKWDRRAMILNVQEETGVGVPYFSLSFY